MLRYFTVPVTPFQQNCSVVYDDATRQAAVIDPGGDLECLLAETDRRELKLEQIWLTHAHIDHAGGTAPAASGPAADESRVDPTDAPGDGHGADECERLVLGLISAFDLAEGSDAVRAHVRQVLRGAGVDRVEVDPGADFDPETQEAVEAQPVTPGDDQGAARPGTVARVVRAGWRRGDRLLRPVEVVVWTR